MSDFGAHTPGAATASLPRGRFEASKTLETEADREEISRAVVRAKAGDREAIRYLYLKFSGNVYGYALGIVRNEHEAEDIAQQVFTRMMTAIGGYQDRSVPFSAWLLRITHNMAIDHLRRRRTVPHEDHHVAPGPEEQRGREMAAALRQALGELPEAQRQVTVLRHFAGLSPGEIAEQLGTSEDSVHGLHHRARKRLRRRLVQLDAVPKVAGPERDGRRGKAAQETAAATV